MKILRNHQYVTLEISPSDEKSNLITELNILSRDKNNLIIDFSKTELQIHKDFFKKIIKKQTLNKKSLVFVSNKYINYDDLNIVPTLTEAIDFVEIEEIERDIEKL